MKNMGWIWSSSLLVCFVLAGCAGTGGGDYAGMNVYAFTAADLASVSALDACKTNETGAIYTFRIVHSENTYIQAAVLNKIN